VRQVRQFFPAGADEAAQPRAAIARGRPASHATGNAGPYASFAFTLCVLHVPVIAAMRRIFLSLLYAVM